MDFRILGPLEVNDDGQALTLGAAKQQVVLAALLLHPNEVVSMSRLVDEVWGDAPPATAAKVIQGYVASLRKVLGAAHDHHQGRRLSRPGRSRPPRR